MSANRTLDEKNAWAAYEKGNMRSALDQFLKLAKSGRPYYFVVAARIIMDGEGGVPVDLNEASELLNFADSLGVREALLQKAELCAKHGDQTNYFEYLKRASTLDVLPAKYYLGLCYLNGQGTDKNSVEGMRLMFLASDDGHLGARIFIARKLVLNPSGAFDIFSGLWLLACSTIKSIVLAFSDPYDDRLR